MKETTNFPYEVICPRPKLELIAKDYNDFKYIYSFKVPEYILLKQDLVDNEESIELVAEVNCSSTMYRELFRSDYVSEIQIEVDKTLLYDSFSIDILILFKKNTEWDNQIVDKGMPIAHLGSYRIDLENRTQGLISFIENDSDNIEYSFTDNTINIKIPSNKYEWLLQNKHNPLLKKILSSQFGQIALIEACQRMKDNANDHLLWQKELKNRWKSFNEDEKEYPDESEIISFVNSLLDNPSDSLLTFLMDNLNKDE